MTTMLCHKDVLKELPIKKRLLLPIKKRLFRTYGQGSTAGTSSNIVKDSPASDDNPKHAVVVMDGMRGFTTEPLRWALENLIPVGCIVTLLGVMPWLNIPLSTKTWLDVWTLELEDSTVSGEQAVNEELRNDVRHLKLKTVIELCKRYEVVPHMEVAMGYPKRLLVVEKVTSLHANWVVFDRHQKKNIKFYMKRLPCKMVMMNGNGCGEMIKSRAAFGSPSISSSASPSLAPPLAPASTISEPFRRILGQGWLDEDDDYDHSIARPRRSV